MAELAYGQQTGQVALPIPGLFVRFEAMADLAKSHEYLEREHEHFKKAHVTEFLCTDRC